MTFVSFFFVVLFFRVESIDLACVSTLPFGFVNQLNVRLTCPLCVLFLPFCFSFQSRIMSRGVRVNQNLSHSRSDDRCA